MTLLVDDRPSSFEAWLERQLDGLAGGIRDDVEAGCAPCMTAAPAPPREDLKRLGTSWPGCGGLWPPQAGGGVQPPGPAGRPPACGVVGRCPIWRGPRPRGWLTGGAASTTAWVPHSPTATTRTWGKGNEFATKITYRTHDGKPEDLLQTFRPLARHRQPAPADHPADRHRDRGPSSNGCGRAMQSSDRCHWNRREATGVLAVHAIGEEPHVLARTKVRRRAG